MAQPLAGLLVLDFTTLLPGPLATLMLAEAGAEVLKIERPGGEEMRAMAAQWDASSAAFAMLNAGKKSLVVDLKADDDRAKLMPLVARADILVEQFRPGTMARLGLDYDTLRRVNPRLIYCSISGYGQTGPRAHEAGHDLNYIGATGLLALQPGPAETPVVPPALIADIGGGSLPAMINILLALRQRDATGAGCHLDIAMADAMFTFAPFALTQGLAGGRFPEAGEMPLVGGSPRYRLYPTKDGKLVACAALEQKFWVAFTAAVALDVAVGADAVAARIREHTADEWRPVLAAADCCVTIVASLDQALRDPHFVQRGLFAHRLALGGGTIPALPLPLAPEFRAPVDDARTTPPLGADSASYLGKI